MLLAPRAGGLAAQRPRRTRAPGRLVAARRQLGARRRARVATAVRAPVFAADDDRHAHDRARHVRCRVYGGPESSDRSDAVQESWRSVLRVARLRTDSGNEASAGRRNGRRGIAEGKRRDRRRGGSAAIPRRHFRAARRRRSHGNRGDAGVAELLRSARRHSRARPRLCPR